MLRAAPAPNNVCPRLYLQGVGEEATAEKAWALAMLAAKRGATGGKELAEQIAGSLGSDGLAAAKKELETYESGASDASEAPQAE